MERVGVAPFTVSLGGAIIEQPATVGCANAYGFDLLQSGSKCRLVPSEYYFLKSGGYLRF